MDHLAFMQRALALAAQKFPHPNPAVGCVIVKNGEIVGEGATDNRGRPHAEIAALGASGDLARGATAYVTLEPHGHSSTSPPCTDALIAAGVSKVVIAMLDPNPSVSGSGVAKLQDAGILVEVGLESEAAEKHLLHYSHSFRTRRPYVVMKAGLTLDGAVAAKDGTSQWITSQEARQDAHRLRAGLNAVMIGAGTLRADDPLLNVRLEQYVDHQPHPVVVAGRAPLPRSARLAEREPLVVTTGGDVPWGRSLVVAPDENGLPDLGEVLAGLLEEGYVSVLAEGGATLNSALWRSGLVDRGVWYLGAKVAGGSGRGVLAGSFDTLADGVDVVIENVRMVGPDIRCEFTRR